MLLYALGCATGAMVSTIVYTKMGWSGVSVLGAATTSAALAIWAATRRGEAR
jgi:predicted MFS family arabinose efflux permease